MSAECVGFPNTDETLLLETAIAHGEQGQSVVVRCVDNMLTADGEDNQTVTCGPTGWTPAQLSPCDGQCSAALPA